MLTYAPADPQEWPPVVSRAVERRSVPDWRAGRPSPACPPDRGSSRRLRHSRLRPLLRRICTNEGKWGPTRSGAGSDGRRSGSAHARSKRRRLVPRLTMRTATALAVTATAFAHGARLQGRPRGARRPASQNRGLGRSAARRRESEDTMLTIPPPRPLLPPCTPYTTCLRFCRRSCLHLAAQGAQGPLRGAVLGPPGHHVGPALEGAACGARRELGVGWNRCAWSRPADPCVPSRRPARSPSAGTTRSRCVPPDCAPFIGPQRLTRPLCISTDRPWHLQGPRGSRHHLPAQELPHLCRGRLARQGQRRDGPHRCRRLERRHHQAQA